MGGWVGWVVIAKPLTCSHCSQQQLPGCPTQSRPPHPTPKKQPSTHLVQEGARVAVGHHLRQHVGLPRPPPLQQP